MAIGGARECLFVEPGLLNIILDRRMGFIRVAMETGAPPSRCLAASAVPDGTSRPHRGRYSAAVHDMH
jgi:Diacylglycerol acyltransferase